MSRRTQTFSIMPWVGGINTSVDSGVLNPQELIQADNVQFSSSGARIKREAFEYIDPAVPTPAFRSSSGTTRTLVFAADELVTTLPDNEKLVVGERITVSGVTNYDATDVPVLSRNDLGSGVFSITYTGTGSLTEAQTAAGSIVIARASKVICATDYWRFATSETNQQIMVYATDDFQLFTVDDGGRRVQVHGQEQTTRVTAAAASTLTTGDHFKIPGPNNTNNIVPWFNIDSGGGAPAVSGFTNVEVAIASTDTDAQVATALAAAIDALSGWSASVVDTNKVSIVAPSSGICDLATDVNTGLTISVTAYGATNPTAAVSQICAGVMNERLIMAFSGIGNYMIKYNPDESEKYQLLFDNVTSAEIGPDASFFFFYQGRMWANDKTNRDRLHYSETFDETKWYGLGDSGALDIWPGDGDPEGILCGYPYKGLAIVGKKSKRYRILGDSPENYLPELISDGLGCEGPLAIPVDESDVVFVSRRGFHSQQATDTYGDTDAAYLSADIKGSFNEFEATQLKYTQGAYIPELNSIAFSVAEDGDSVASNVWLYNLEVRVPGKDRPGVWYRWPDVSCTALTRRFKDGKYRLVFGTNDGRLIQAQKPSDFADFGETGIPFMLKTGTIYPGNDPHSMKAFKKISMIYRPKGNFAFTVKAYVDNQDAQAWSFNQISGLDLLGTTFVLGNSILGSSNTLAPFTYTMEGYGRGIILEITQPTADEQVEIWGFIIEYENADLIQAPEDS